MNATDSPRKLYKDPANKAIAGVCAGFAKYFNIDVVIVRVVWVATILVGGFGAVLYVIFWLVLDDEPQEAVAPAPTPSAEPPAAEAAPEEAGSAEESSVPEVPDATAESPSSDEESESAEDDTAT